jgi:hypothetical protein
MKEPSKGGTEARPMRVVSATALRFILASTHLQYHE